MNERLPHPKRLSEQTARDLRLGKIDIPDSEKLREASQHDPDTHVQDEELVKTKAERFAILAHLAAEISDEIVVGEDREVRFYYPVEHTEYTETMRLTSFMALENDLFDYSAFSIIAKEVLREEKNAAVVARFKEIIMRIATDPASDTERPFYTTEDTIENRLSGFTYDIIASTLVLMKLIKKHIQTEHSNSSAEQTREIMLHNIDFLESLAAKNLAHSQKMLKVTMPDHDGVEQEYETAFEYSDLAAKTTLEKDGDSFSLKLHDKLPKPKVGLFGATMGCPANYHLDEGDTVIRKYATAIINLAYDRGIFAEKIDFTKPPYGI